MRRSLSCVMNAHKQCTGRIPGSGVKCECTCHYGTPTKAKDSK